MGHSPLPRDLGVANHGATSIAREFIPSDMASQSCLIHCSLTSPSDFYTTSEMNFALQFPFNFSRLYAPFPACREGPGGWGFSKMEQEKDRYLFSTPPFGVSFLVTSCKLATVWGRHSIWHPPSGIQNLEIQMK